jgi:hypothetical protein
MLTFCREQGLILSMTGFQPGPDGAYPPRFTPGVSKQLEKAPKLLNRDRVPPARQREGLRACRR